MKAGVNVYMSQGTKDALCVTGHRVVVVKAGEQINIGSWRVLPFRAEHECAEPLGFLLASNAGEKLLYLTDSCYCRHTFSGLNYILLECNYCIDIVNANATSGVIPSGMKKRLVKNHMSLKTAKQFLQANDLSKVTEIHLIHLSDKNSNAERFQREVQELTGKPVYIATGW